MTGRVELVWLGGRIRPIGPSGRVHRVAASGAAIADCLARELGKSDAEAWLFWAGRLGPPDARRVDEALGRPGDVWHAGTAARDGGPSPRHRFRGADVDAQLRSGSRDRGDVLATLARSLPGSDGGRCGASAGSARSSRRSPAAGLELGHRWVTRGALMRHLPALARRLPTPRPAPIPLEDEMRFVYYRFGRFWLRWSLLRAVLTKGGGLNAARAAPPPPRARAGSRRRRHRCARRSPTERPGRPADRSTRHGPDSDGGPISLSREAPRAARAADGAAARDHRRGPDRARAPQDRPRRLASPIFRCACSIAITPGSAPRAMRASRLPAATS